MNVSFTNEFTLSKIDEIVSFLAGPRLMVRNTDYPDILDWFQKVSIQLASQEKRAVIALDGAELSGVIIYQRHRVIADALEIKNLTVRPQSAGRKMATFLMRAAETEGLRDFKTRKVLCDAKAGNIPVRMFLLWQGYLLADHRDLYKKGAGIDSVFTKTTVPGLLQP